MFFLQKFQSFLIDRKIYSKYLSNNNRFFDKIKYDTNKKILVEYFNFKPSFISYSYFSNILSKKHKANIFFFNPSPKKNYQKIYAWIKDIFNLSNLKFVKSLNGQRVITPSLKSTKLTNIIYKKIVKKIKNKQDILDIKIFSIPVGDLIYDEYLARYQKGTIDIRDENFLSFLKYSIDLFLYWYKKLNRSEIKSLICSHTTYFIGLPARVAAFKSIPCYCISNSFASYLTKNNYRQYPAFTKFPSIFKKIPKNISKRYKNVSKRMIMKFFINKNKFNTKKFFEKRVNKSKNFNVLVAAHCFSDAVHIHGKDRIFVDHFDWINFLGKVSLKTDYRWLIKLHPSQYDNNFEKMNDLIKNYPNLQLLPKETKTLDLLKKINCALTVHGTVAREYPLFNIPVLNASHDGPYVGYNFSHSFKSLKKYKNALMNLKKFKVNKKELNKIYEQYSVKYCLHYHFMGFEKHMSLMKKFKSKNLRESKFILDWNNLINLKKHNRHLLDVKNFVNNKRHVFWADNTSEESKYLNI